MAEQNPTRYDLGRIFYDKKIADVIYSLDITSDPFVRLIAIEEIEMLKLKLKQNDRRAQLLDNKPQS